MGRAGCDLRDGPLRAGRGRGARHRRPLTALRLLEPLPLEPLPADVRLPLRARQHQREPAASGAGRLVADRRGPSRSGSSQLALHGGTRAGPPLVSLVSRRRASATPDHAGPEDRPGLEGGLTSRTASASEGLGGPFMQTRGMAISILALAIGARGAAAVPWPGDDSGSLTLDKATSKCEQKANQHDGKAVGAILQCQTKLVAAAFDGTPFDEQACENTAEAAFTAKTITTDCPCVAPAGIIAIVEPVVNANTGLTYCDPAGATISGLPDNGAAQIDGTVPSSIEILKYQDKVGKFVAKLVADFLKCHQKFAAAYQKLGGTPDETAEEACEAAALAKFNTAVGVMTGGQGCEDIPGLVQLTTGQLEGANLLTFCASPSAAFVR